MRWGNTLNKGKGLNSGLNIRKELSNFVFEYLNDPYGDEENKINFIKIFALECKKEHPRVSSSVPFDRGHRIQNK